MPIRPLTPELIDPLRQQGIWLDTPLYRLVDAHAERTPDALAVADQHERLTYAELVARSSAFARWLAAQDLPAGSIVASQTGNRVALAVTHLACNRADMTFLPLSTQWRRTELESLLRRSGVAVLVLPPPYKGVDFFSMVEEMRSELPRLLHVGGSDGLEADFDFDAVVREAGPVVAPDRDPDLPGFITVTSGTTEIPRMSQWTDNNVSFLMRDYISAVELRPGDVALAIAPANTGATGYLFPVLAPICAGAASILLEDWSPTAAVELLETEHATHAAAIPTQLVKMLQDPTVAQRDFSAVRVITSAGAPLTPDTAALTESSFGCVVSTVYGSTDGGVITLTRTSDPIDKRRTSVGCPVPGAELILLDAEGNTVDLGVTGEVVWRTPTKSCGYLGDDERTDAMFKDEGWYHSGDLGALDEDGYLSIVGRSKDLIIRGGQNISPLEIEQILARHEAVSEVAVVGVPDPVFGERACACVVVRAGAQLTLDEVITFMKAQDVAPFKVPEMLELFDELPRTGAGKLSKVSMRSAVAERTAGR
ncbi:MAG: cyclohexanecarboxylate-CoA ligase [Pseudonocardiales bacterium]|nr:cyclohexanecarboxylate-CoA ligase [Pseudonocardiales bacterium]